MSLSLVQKMLRAHKQGSWHNKIDFVNEDSREFWTTQLYYKRLVRIKKKFETLPRLSTNIFELIENFADKLRNRIELERIYPLDLAFKF